MQKSIPQWLDLIPSSINDSIVDGKRRYNIDGKFYPSVTTVIGAFKSKDWLNEWIARVGKEEANRITAESCRIGTQMHTIIEKFLKNEDIDKYQKTEGYKLFKRMCPLLKDIEFPLNEIAVWSHELKIAGRVDCLAMYKGVPSIIDFKSSKSDKTQDQIYDYFIQTTLYALLLWDCYKIKTQQIVIMIAVRDSVFPQIFIFPIHKYMQEAITIVRDYYDRDNHAEAESLENLEISSGKIHSTESA